ncbi:UDP-N-acetylmuramoyl-L-alanyl-D-glutamate--2,6-diaminopimelate ligase [Psychrobacillus sp. OK032]|uniref:UDP-N-acetylmuramoyl-L-alanyl-D-glutamate--2, 6-diaminopimelate ligase n=1 Tax=Psychrobacillus sp. OK032 TaxID=1884358 RepID=UPI0008D22CCE|nr:UDP-N-acetylmuramoyl-L-alanyl-D-glutamate--2,6-diaminopimelate ligase [Psychrobacillus sp. OK032]SER58928.1 UDP-N-acetylmuramoylalanyl-D-glutamate--2,6-diaminopimelate ligase [Psychrobacillus sp. OK032]
MINRFIDHSKQIREGDMFVSETGNRVFIEEAIQKGAKAILTEYFIHDCSVPQVILPKDMHLLKERISSMAYELYGKEIKTIGITGTNGKTTVASFIGQLLMQQQKTVCVIGTLGVYINGQKLDLPFRSNTTLPFYDFLQVVKYCFEHKVEYIVLEASSQGLLDNRLGMYPIDLGVFLNIGKDHLEFHGGMVPYKKSKELLVTLSKHIVINDDDDWCKSIAEKTELPVTRFGEQYTNEVILQKVDYSTEIVHYKFLVRDKEVQLQMKNSGYYNGMNIAAAIASLTALNIPFGEIKALTLPKGRLEQILNSKGIEVLIDYAHTPDALEACLSTITSYVKNDIYVVFGCGGNRDKQKRKGMGEVASKFATKVIITSDNPRNERPEDIIAEIVSGVNLSEVMIEPDREKAINLALRSARKGDVILIAGKGHEQEQIANDLVVPFSDHQVVRNYFEEPDGLITKNDPVA